ncbi:uncharacterized protein LOC107272587 isoform X2 [Cephus cinctus]|uniref:Uncharacterized protein LOC107272587 isoform X2 n=1 Tax=Cephus cinctus TaxID=211228 RepID=A0AAJ7W6F6_CEPCN|nr:uncharacterized protein LOC107272587 isoform X2 [Cephus cinctus]
MCTEGVIISTGKSTSILPLLLIIGIVITCGLCQNAEPFRSIERKSLSRMDEDYVTEANRKLFNWDAAPVEEKPLNESKGTLLAGSTVEAKTEVVPGGNGNKDVISLVSQTTVGTTSYHPRNVTTISESGRIKDGRRGSHKKRRRNKDLRRKGSRSRGNEPELQAEILRSSKRNESSVALNEIKRRVEGRGRKGQGKYKLGNRGRQKTRIRTGSKVSGGKFENAKLQMERRRRNRERRRRRRGRKFRENKALRGIKNTQVDRPAPAALLLGKDGGTGWDEEFANINKSDARIKSVDWEVPSSTLNSTSSVIELELPSLGTGAPSTPRRTIFPMDEVDETMEKELSKEVRKDVSRSYTRMLDPYEDQMNIEESARAFKKRLEGLEGARFDAEKMLGYSRSENDLPNLDLGQDVLAKSLKDYNNYITSKLEAAKLSEMQYKEDGVFGPDQNGTGLMADTPLSAVSFIRDIPRAPILIQDEPTTTTSSDAENLHGDLSCINGTFLPAPLAWHALIKYVKSSIPGHEYLEADYECTPGFYMVSKNSRLLCQNRQWIGRLPKCKIRQSPGNVCADSSCDQVCKEVDGIAQCSCYKGFRLEDDRCIDVNECEDNNGAYINECLLNNGHGPCQDTCRNLEGSYQCSCEGIPDTILSIDKHTCQDANPCSIDNAGCSHTCLSTMGRVFCLCPDGFMLEDDWKTCQDIDECSVPDLQAEVCHHGCVNTPGSYRCADPLELKDQPILDTAPALCGFGYQVAADGSCIDVNECATDNGGCQEVCENTEGSFFCSCDGDEKALTPDGKSCIDIDNVACPPLNPVGRGYVVCSKLTTPKPWRGRRRLINRPGTKCYLKCPHGYQLHGEYELTCRSDGTWDGPKHGECVRYSKPRLECPKDVVAEVSPGRDEAFVSFSQPDTDLDWFRYVRSKPSWGTRLEANLTPGTHEVTFFARHPVSKKQTSCVLRITVKDGEAPKVDRCPSSIEVIGKNGTAVSWNEPIFTDNIKVARITSNKKPGQYFDLGQHKIEYEASDEAGWTSKCIFAVGVRQE